MYAAIRYGRQTEKTANTAIGEHDHTSSTGALQAAVCVRVSFNPGSKVHVHQLTYVRHDSSLATVARARGCHAYLGSSARELASPTVLTLSLSVANSV